MDCPAPLIAGAARSQLDLIRATEAVTAVQTSSSELGAAFTCDWDSTWATACLDLQIVRGFSPHEALAALWEQVELVADLATQAWWSEPALRDAAVGQIVWSTTTGDPAGTTAPARLEWQRSHRLIQTIQRQTRGALMFGYRGGVTRRLKSLTQRWEDAWWAWAAPWELGHLESGLAVTAPARPWALAAFAQLAPLRTPPD